MSEKPAPRFFDSTVAILATQVSGLIAIFFINLIISRKFGEAGKGYVSLILYTVDLLYALTNLALGFTGQYFVSKRLAPPRQVYSNIVAFSLAAAIPAALIFLLSHDLWSGLVQNLSLEQLFPIVVIFLCLSIYDPSCQLLIAIGRIGKRTIAVLVQSYFLLAGLVVLSILSINSLQAVVWLYIIDFAAVATLTFSFAKSEVGTPNQPSLDLFKSTMRYGRWIYIANLVTHIAARVDFYLLTGLGSIAMAGVYSVASGLTSPLLTITLAVHTVFYPKTASSSDEDAAVTTPFYYRQSFLVMLGGAAIVAVLARPVLQWYGPGFVTGLDAMYILLFAVILRGLNGILSLHILGRGKSYTRVISTLFAMCVGITLNLLLIPRYGMIGAAVATLSGALSENIVLNILYRVLVHGRVSDLYRFGRRDFTIIFSESVSFLKRLRKT